MDFLLEIWVVISGSSYICADLTQRLITLSHFLVPGDSFISLIYDNYTPASHCSVIPLTFHTFTPGFSFCSPLCLPALPGPADAGVEDDRPIITALTLLELSQPPGEAADTEAQCGPRHCLFHSRPVGSGASVRSPAPVRGQTGQGALGRGRGGVQHAGQMLE